MARRLVESGARFVEVTTEYVPFLHWDTHAEGHTTMARMHSEIDRPIAQLILDLEARKLLDRTLVIIASEFSRDAIIEGKPGSNANDQATHKVDTVTEMKHYGLHRHFTGGTSVVMFGGGTRRGFLYGETAEERPLVARWKSGHRHRSARHDHDGDGNQPQNGIRDRRPPVLRDPGRQGCAGTGCLCLSVRPTPQLAPLCTGQLRG